MIFRLRMSYLTSALLFCGSFNALASTISGTVSNELNEPVAGAKITLLEAMDTGQIVGRIVDLSSGAGVGGAQVFIDVKPELGGRSPVIAISDSEGYYTLVGLEQGNYTVGVWLRGYETQYHMNIPVNPGKNSEQDLVIGSVEVDEDYLVILRAEFDAIKFHPDHDAAWAEKMYFDDTPGASSVRNFFYQASHGRFDLKKGANVLINVTPSELQYPHDNYIRDDVVDWVVDASRSLVDYSDPKLDRSKSWDHAPGSDNKIDSVVVITAGMPKSITGSDCDMNPVSMLNSETVGNSRATPVQALLPEYSPLGNIVHEMFHSMGETAVQDLYMNGECDVDDEVSTPIGTVGKWGTMGVGMYNKIVDRLADPRTQSCEIEYIDPCEGQDGQCIASGSGVQPSMPTPWSLERWYHKRFWKSDVVKNETLAYGSSQTVRLYPWSTSGDQTQVITVNSSDSKKWWTITNRQPIGVDHGLVYNDGEGQTGIVIDYNDETLKGRMQLKGPVRIRDSHPGTVPDYPHFTCRSHADDGAFNIGEVDSYSEGSLDVQLLEAHDDGSITVFVATDGTSPTAALTTEPNEVLVKTANTEDESEHSHHASIELKVSGSKQTEQASLNNVRSITNEKPKSAMVAEPVTLAATAGSVVYSDNSGQYVLSNIANSDWVVEVDACGFAQVQQPISLNSSTNLDFSLIEDNSRVLDAVISAPVPGGNYTSGKSVALNAASSNIFGQTSFEWRSDLDGLLSTKATDNIILSLGSHVISLSLTNELCQTNTEVSIHVVEGPVNELPVASFAVNTTDLTASFTDASSDSDGSVSVWAWDFGDGNTSAQSSPSHTYASAGDYTVSLTVTDDQQGQSSITQLVTVTASTDPSALQNGVAKSPMVVGNKEEIHYHINIPAGVSNMTIALSGDGDGDLYVKLGAQASRDYQGADYKSAKWKSNDSITIESPAQGTWYIMVYGYKAMTTGSLQVDFN